MERPYVNCHMTISINGKVTGDFLSRENSKRPIDVYYEINRKYKREGYNGFICGRVTMDGSFTFENRVKIDGYIESEKKDFIPSDLTGFYAVAFDPKGKLGWTDRFITDEDEGYDKAQVVEVLTRKVDGRYLTYLREKNIPYIFAGEELIDVKVALKKLKEMGMEKLLLEGGSVVNGYFLDADCVDELSLVLSPVVADKDDKPLFCGSKTKDFTLINSEVFGGVIVMNFKKA